jgi:hypothetical protein
MSRLELKCSSVEKYCHSQYESIEKYATWEINISLILGNGINENENSL